MKGLILMLITIVPAVSYASDGDATVIPWSTLITLVLVAVTALAGGLLGAARKAVKSSYEAMKILSDALDDQKINDEEIKQIVAASVNCHASWKDVIKRVGELFKKSAKV